jgi:hypothetical protein
MITDGYSWLAIVLVDCVDVQASLRDEEYATIGIRERIATALEDPNLAELGFQPNEPFDLLSVPSTVDKTSCILILNYYSKVQEEPLHVPFLKKSVRSLRLAIHISSANSRTSNSISGFGSYIFGRHFASWALILGSLKRRTFSAKLQT